uniref:Uncharacterized protein n=1 Tax=Photinus pyralis TaxID=7054 RepID=A0A1Y1MXB6_PHOPY
MDTISCTNNYFSCSCWCCNNNKDTSDDSITQFAENVHSKAADERLIDCSSYDLYDGESNSKKYIEIGYSTHLNLAPVLRIVHSPLNAIVMVKEDWEMLLKHQTYLEMKFFRSQELENWIDWSNVKEEDIEHDKSSESLNANFTIHYNRKFVRDTTTTEKILESVTIQRDKLHYCTMSKYVVEELFNLKDIINYRLDLLESYALSCFYQDVIEQVINYRHFRKMEFGNEDEGDDDNIYRDIEDVLNYKFNVNSHNTVCMMELLYYRPTYFMYHICQ